MRENSRYIILALLLLALGGLIYLMITAGLNNKIRKENTVKKEAKEAYIKAKYIEAFDDLFFLFDSMNVNEDEIPLNLAHSGFLLSRMDSTAHNLLREMVNGASETDSTRKDDKAYEKCLNYYQNLSDTTKDNLIASLALNQLGILTYRYRNQKDASDEENSLERASDFFQSAIKKDTKNEIARYNFELIHRKIDYPERIMAEVKSLIDHRQYREARDLIKEALNKDRLMKSKYSDFAERLETVIKIDSLSRS